MEKIKELAEHALKLQNKDVMDETLREIVKLCTPEEEVKPVKKGGK